MKDVLNHPVRSTLALALAFASLAAAGCGDKSSQQQPPQQAGYPQQYPQQQYPGQQAGYPQGQYPQGQMTPPPPGYPGSAPPQATTAPGTPAAPGAVPGQLPGTLPQGPAGQPAPAAGGVSGTATVIDPNLAALATGPLGALAATDAPGMSPEGALMAGQFQQGQTLEQAITISPGRCYTFLAVGAGPQEVDISVVAVTPLPGMSPVLGKDSSTGTKATLGAKANCFKLAIVPVPVQAKWVITAAKGGGLIAGQAFAK